MPTAKQAPALRLRSREPMENLSLRLPTSVVRAIASAAEQHRSFPSEVARAALIAGLEQFTTPAQRPNA